MKPTTIIKTLTLTSAALGLGIEASILSEERQEHAKADTLAGCFSTVYTDVNCAKVEIIQPGPDAPCRATPRKSSDKGGEGSKKYEWPSKELGKAILIDNTTTGANANLGEITETCDPPVVSICQFYDYGIHNNIVVKKRRWVVVDESVQERSFVVDYWLCGICPDDNE